MSRGTKNALTLAVFCPHLAAAKAVAAQGKFSLAKILYQFGYRTGLSGDD